MTELFSTTTLTERVTIFPHELNHELNTHVLKKIRDKLTGENGHGSCTQYGYIKSVDRVLKKIPNPKVSDSGRGECIIDVMVEVNSYLPVIGQEIECTISAIDEHIGESISFQLPIFILIINDTDDVLRVNQTVKVRIEDFQLKHGDDIINLVATYLP
jgi:DNA-directed RNA polymerase subunit E'/Rpb7